jgi:hypothetical protein
MLRQSRRPLHERLPLLNWLRGPLRRWFFHFLRRTWETDEGKRMAADALRGLLLERPVLQLAPEAISTQPYSDLPALNRAEKPFQRNGVVIITARFRSGSTLLWNLFRHVEGFTAYYEPFNERRWFDPRHRGERIDPSHKQVSDYWKEYDGLSEVAKYYDERWIDRELYMSADAWNPAMKRFVEILIARAAGRAALQFNRIDFRLPWFRRHFPRARLIHLYRHPRDQWMSALTEESRCFPRDGRMADFARHDHFYLLRWARDLRYQFPFLDADAVEHPYQLHYYLWKLSYLFGRAYADYSLAFESLVQQPEAELPKLLAVVEAGGADVSKLISLIIAPPLAKWRDYADDAWFRRHETPCEEVLEEFLGPHVSSAPEV